jgi:hypothetical protein
MSTKSALRADLDAEDRKTLAQDAFLVGHHLERAAGSRSAIAARTVTAPPGRDTANSATSPIRSSASLRPQVGGVAYRCPIEFRHQVAQLEPGTLGRRLRVDLEDCQRQPEIG